MKDAGRANGQKPSRGKFFAFLRKKGSGKAKRSPEAQSSEPSPVLSAEELAAIEAERERLAQEMIQREIDSMVRAEGSRLYQVFQLHHGLPPVTDDKGCYSLAVFTDNNDLPTYEERALLIRLDRELAPFYDYAFDPMASVRAESAAADGYGAPGNEVEANVRSKFASRKSIDATCRVLMPDDALNAYLFVLPPQDGGSGFTKDDVAKALKSEKVSFGVIDECIDAVVVQQKYLAIVKVAEGMAPTDGIDGEIVDRFYREVKIRLKERADGTIDYRDLGWLQTAGKGDVICDIIPPLPQKDGKNVCGKPVPGKTGMEAEPPVGDGAIISDDGSKILAAMDGVVLFRQDCFHVEPLLTIESDVDTGVGNLDLIGSVIIHGDIRGGYSVKATGNITVRGRVENATVKAGGSIQVGNGMNGSETGVLRAEGDVACRYIEHSTVSAGNSVVSDTIVNSNVSAGNAIEVTTGRATIVGGRVAARNRIQAQTVGNYGNTLTTVILGETLESLEEKQELTQKNIALGKELAEKEKGLKHFEQRPVLNPDARKKYEDYKRAIQALRISIQDNRGRLDAIERSKPPNTGCFLRAGVVHPPLELTISGVRSTIRTGTSGVRYVLRSGEVIQIPY